MKKTLLIAVLAVTGMGFVSTPAVPQSAAIPEKKWTVAELEALVARAEKTHRLPRRMLDAIVRLESSYRIKAVNPSSAEGVAVSSFGLGQLTEDTAKHHCKLTAEEIHNPIKNIMCAAKVLRYQLDRYRSKENRVAWAIASYNWGTPCACNGTVYTKSVPRYNKAERRMVKEEVTCRRKGTLEPLTCSLDEEGKFLNQEYVEKWRDFYNTPSTQTKLASQSL